MMQQVEGPDPYAACRDAVEEMESMLRAMPDVVEKMHDGLIRGVITLDEAIASGQLAGDAAERYGLRGEVSWTEIKRQENMPEFRQWLAARLGVAG